MSARRSDSVVGLRASTCWGTFCGSLRGGPPSGGDDDEAPAAAKCACWWCGVMRWLWARRWPCPPALRLLAAPLVPVLAASKPCSSRARVVAARFTAGLAGCSSGLARENILSHDMATEEVHLDELAARAAGRPRSRLKTVESGVRRDESTPKRISLCEKLCRLKEVLFFFDSCGAFLGHTQNQAFCTFVTNRTFLHAFARP